MRYYEIVFMIHPDCNEQIPNIVEHYTAIVTNAKGQVNRVENWGRRQLAYSIKKLRKAYYLLLNVMVSQDIIDKLKNDLKFHDIIIRRIIIRTKYAETNPSPIMRKQENNKENNVNDVSYNVNDIDHRPDEIKNF